MRIEELTQELNSDIFYSGYYFQLCIQLYIMHLQSKTGLVVVK